MIEDSSAEMELNIADLCPATRALGPGLRSALWVQGCPLRCPGCIAPDWLEFRPALRLSPTAAAARLLADPAIEGISLSGGEPTAQAPALAAMLRRVRAQRPELHILCFSGYPYETLLTRPPESGVPALLAEIDLLVDGPYLQAHNLGDTFAGSRNQRLIPLSERPLPGTGPWALRRMEVHIRGGSILAVGVPPREWPRDLLQGAAQARSSTRPELLP
jgi:anaerobic ribonucleoside-triphosphate reductase activating protein